MATSENPELPKLSDLHDRLDRLSERIAQIRSSSSIDHPDFKGDLSTFSDRHLSIRSAIDEIATESALSKADRDTSDLESHLERWMHGIDEKYAHVPPRINSVSM